MATIPDHIRNLKVDKDGKPNWFGKIMPIIGFILTVILVIDWLTKPF